MSLTPEQITAQNFKDFYDGLKPYLNSYIPFQSHFNHGDLYSTDEKLIGQWIDGKPLYQKTLEFTASLGTNTYAHNIINLESIVSMDGMLLTDRPIPYVNVASLGNQVQLQCSSTTGISVNIEQSVFVGRRCCVTIRYTKTTDTAIEIGTADDYSTTEKIVGTWIDGKPIYQKTIEINNPATDWSAINLLNGINAENVMKVDAEFYQDSVWLSEFYNTSSDFISCGIFGGVNIVCRIKQAGNPRITKALITIRYTKTT